MKKVKRWFELDNAAKLYPAISNSHWSSTFRVSAELAEPVEPGVLQQALDQTLQRFPTFQVQMRAGVFWYFLEEITDPLQVRLDVGHPGMPFRFRKDHGYLIRVLYFQNRISVEFFHSLTDGTGGMVFLKTLVVSYLRLLGHNVQYDHGALDITQHADQEETRDAFLQMPLPGVRASRKESKAWHFPATKDVPHTLHTIAASIPCDMIVQKAHEKKVSVSAYLVSVMLYVAVQEQRRLNVHRLKPVRVSLPVNMRTFYPSRTMRNFSTFVNPGIDPQLGEYTFDEILHEVSTYICYATNPRLMAATIATNVSDEKMLLIRLAPLFIKNLVISSVYRRAGDKLVTSTLSNLGKTEAPTGAESLIQRFEFQLGVPGAAMCNCSCVSYRNELRLVFSSNVLERTLPCLMLHFLVEQGVPVEVESNDEEE